MAAPSLRSIVGRGTRTPLVEVAPGNRDRNANASPRGRGTGSQPKQKALSPSAFCLVLTTCPRFRVDTLCRRGV